MILPRLAGDGGLIIYILDTNKPLTDAELKY